MMFRSFVGITLVFFSDVNPSKKSLIAAGTIAEDAPIQTLQFMSNITHRTNMCQKQLLFRAGLIEFKDLLRGMNLSVALVYNAATGMINYDEAARDFEPYPGLIITILDELASRAGFEWRNSWGAVFPAHLYDGYRLKPNATVDDALFWSVNAYDISATAWDETLERLRLGITFPGVFDA